MVTWISNHTHDKVLDEITYPFQNFKSSFKNFVDDYFICDWYHLLESLNFDNKDAINTCFKHFVDCLDGIVIFHAPLKT